MGRKMAKKRTNAAILSPLILHSGTHSSAAIKYLRGKNISLKYYLICVCNCNGVYSPALARDANIVTDGVPVLCNRADLKSSQLSCQVLGNKDSNQFVMKVGRNKIYHGQWCRTGKVGGGWNAIPKGWFGESVDALPPKTKSVPVTGCFGDC
ncbi:hypothetical protein CEXT_96901 [Caerostris extrusa]|uniref:Uncharacterized protein n=1 Tax=Caerostris extrusa TaxID=172846 RepID=A0AAV4NNK9_CAEEX|nr:hypothetical protein CEXT_96901 [Caerostris extrusa]